VAGLPDNLLLDLTLRQPFLRPESEDRDHVLIASIVVAPSTLDISPFGLIVVLCLVKSKAHQSALLLKRKMPQQGA
jgi:pectin methylesterase-like acyl-CoA thioesterase